MQCVHAYLTEIIWDSKSFLTNFKQKLVIAQNFLFVMIFPKSTQKPNRNIKITIFLYAKNFIFWPLGKNLGRDLKLNINPV